MKEFWNRPPLAMAFHCVHSLTFILGAFIILWNSTREDAKDPESICHSTREVPGPQLTLTISVSLSVEAHSFLTDSLVFFMEIVIFEFCYLYSKASVSVFSGFKVYAYISIFTGCWVKYAWLILRCERLCRAFVPEVALKLWIFVMAT